MAMISGGELVVRTLLKAGVKCLFGLHGAHIDTIFQACLDHDLTIIDTRHEAAAGHAAEGYARAGRTLGVALVTAGGGFTNVVTPIANAWLDRTPILVLTGSGAVRDDETNTLQAGIDQVAIAAPITKWAHRVLAVDHIPRLVMQAIRLALTGPRGPVLLDLPWDVLANQIDEDSVVIPDLILPAGGAQPSPVDLSRALDGLRAAQRPAIVLGSEPSRAVPSQALARLATVIGAPVFADYEGLNLLSNLPEPIRGGLVQNLYSFAKADAAPDVVLLLGARFGLNTGHGSGQLIPHAARVIQVDPDARELGRLQTIAQGIVADVGGTIEALADAAEACSPWPNRSTWCATVAELVGERYRSIAEKADSGAALHPFHASEVIARHVDAGVTVVADGALTYLWLSEVMSRVSPGGFLCHGYLGSMGVGFGTALGAQMAGLAAGNRTILVTGDGSVGYSIGEFDTLVRKKLPVIVVIMNNQSWGATLHFQQLAVGPNRVTGTRLENGAYHAVAAAFGVDGYHVDSIASFEAALTEALAHDRPACINVAVALDPIPPEELILIGMDPLRMTDLAFGQPDNGIIQMAYTVADLDVAMGEFTANLRVGPWFVFRRLSGKTPIYRGSPSLAANDVALGFAGHMQIELIQPLDQHPSVCREAIAARGYGFHHFGVAARDFDQACEDQAAKGYTLAFTDAVEGGGRVAYFDTHGILPGMLELIEASPAVESLFTTMYEAARDWDGSDPVRAMPTGDL